MIRFHLPSALVFLFFAFSSVQAQIPSIRLGEVRGGDTRDGRTTELDVLNTGDPALLHAVPREDGLGYRTLIGKFVSAVSGAETNEDVARAATIAFLNDNKDLFGLQGDVQPSWLRLNASTNDGDFAVYDFSQMRASIPIYDAGLVVVFYSDGDIYSISGQVETHGANSPGFVRTVEFAIATAARVLDRPLQDATADPPAIASIRDVRGIFTGERREDTGVVLAGLDRSTMRPIWVLQTSTKEVIIDDMTGVVTSVNDRAPLYTVSTTCRVRHMDFVRDGDAFADSMTMVDGSGTLLVATVSDDAICGANDYFGICPWQLHRTNVNYGLERVQDETGAEIEDVQGCSDTTNPSFQGASTTGSFDEQNAFMFGHRAAIFANQNLFAAVSPVYTVNSVEYYVNSTSVTRYWDIFHDITINPSDERRYGPFAHEYGHHALHAYGLSFPGTCSNNVNESNRVSETFANVIMYIATADDNALINMAYDADTGNMNNNVGPHLSSGGGDQDDGTNDCNEDIHFEATGLEQAMWELLYNRDCSNGCSGPGAANEIWIGSIHETVIFNVGDAVAAGMKNTPDDTTYEDVIAQMSARWVSRFGSTVAARAMSVIGHHNR